MRKNSLSLCIRTEPRSSPDARLGRGPTGQRVREGSRPTLRLVSRGPQSEGWQATEPGPHTIRVRFDKPTSIRRIHLEFCEKQVERSQEFILSAVAAGRRLHIVRQQWTFSPDGSTHEVEDYTVNLPAVTTLELHINPDRHNDQAYASLESLAIA